MFAGRLVGVVGQGHRLLPIGDFCVGLLDSVDQILATLAMAARQPLGSMTTLETTDDKRTSVASDGSLMTIMRN